MEPRRYEISLRRESWFFQALVQMFWVLYKLNTKSFHFRGFFGRANVKQCVTKYVPIAKVIYSHVN